MEAFRAADGDGSGTISKRELYKILEAAALGLSEPGPGPGPEPRL